MARNRYQRPDHFSRRARDQGYAARSVYKLQEIQRRTPILRPGDRAVDLGCYPGSWSRYMREQIGVSGALVGVDLQEVQGVQGTFLAQSIYDVTPEQLLEALGGPADAVLSDMAPRTTGDRSGDHLRQIALVERALEITAAIARPGSHFVAKVFDGRDAQALMQRLRGEYARVKRIKPQATRSRSVEFFAVGLDRQG